MTVAEMIKKLEMFARQSDDGARAEELVADAFCSEYDLGLSKPGDMSREWTDAEAIAWNTQHDRSLEIYPYVIEKRRTARRLREEAELFREMAELLRNPESLNLRLLREEKPA
jgi:hypothetical protein